ncbi:hypothetical protein [Cyclobacterium xiamenense]|uniref:hypothetical protein n=1 Tax=Cyclobacterium xiamenense TaxID=1297121 RepID=UPI0035CEB6CE
MAGSKVSCQTWVNAHAKAERLTNSEYAWQVSRPWAYSRVSLSGTITYCQKKMPATDAQVERLIEQEMGCGRKGRNQLT